MAKATTKKVEPPAAPEAGPVNLELLTSVAEATRAGGFVYLKAEGKPLVDLALVVINTELHDAHGNPAAKVTEAGEAYLVANGIETPSKEKAPKVEATNKFEIKSGFVVPEATRTGGGGKQSVYPFESLEVGQYFFIPNSEAKPKAAKDYASTVSSANARLQPKRFKIVEAEGGANVGRIADYDDAGLAEAKERSAKRAAARKATADKKAAEAKAAAEKKALEDFAKQGTGAAE